MQTNQTKTNKTWAIGLYILTLIVLVSSCAGEQTGPGSESFFDTSSEQTADSYEPDIWEDSSDLISDSTSSDLPSEPEDSYIPDEDSSDSQDNSSIPEEDSSQYIPPIEESKDENPDPEVPKKREDYMRGMWVSQYDLQGVYVSDGNQRDIEQYKSMIDTVVSNIKKDGFNTVFLHIRPFGDSLYESELFPVSRYVSGAYGKGLDYDPIEIFVSKATKAGLEVHGWINPLRLMTPGEIKKIDDKYLIKQWYSTDTDRIVEVSGRLYLNPAYPEAIDLICDGAAEILDRYGLAGIHIDDYFYPTTDPSFDKSSFQDSSYSSLTEFRENNINLLVRTLYDRVHITDKNAVFGVSPAGNLSTVRSIHYADVRKWCSEKGYIDYIIPQIYFGFLHGVCPFAKTVDDWGAIVTEPSIKYYVGLSGGNAFAGYKGEISAWAVTEEGKNEWIKNKDVLKRSFEYIFAKDNIDGYVFFCYQYLYTPTTGAPAPNLRAEYDNFIKVIKASIK